VQQYEYVRRNVSGPSVPVCVLFLNFILGSFPLLRYRIGTVTDQRFLWNIGRIVLERKSVQVPLFIGQKTHTV